MFLIITGVSLVVFFLVFLYSSHLIEIEKEAYNKGFRDALKNNYKYQCDFKKCQHYLTCKKDKGVVCEDFAECKTYMDAYDNDLWLWKELHGWEDEDNEWE